MNKYNFLALRHHLLLCFVAGPLLSPYAFSADPIDHLNVKEPDVPACLPKNPVIPCRLPPLPSAPPESGALPGSGGESFFVKRILFRGNAVIPSSDLEAISAAYAERHLDKGDIEALRQKLSHYYVERGYVNSGALLGEDALVGETLTFQIVEGRLKTLRLQGLEGLNQAYVAGRLIKDKDETLNVDTLRERFQLLLDDLLFKRMNARLMPDLHLGEAILDIDVVRARPYQLSVFANNYRPPSIGANALGISGWIRNLSGYGDVLDASLQNSLPDGESPRFSIGWRLPLNQRGTQFALQVERGRSSVVEEPVAILDIKSHLDTMDLGLSQTVLESLQHKITLGIDRVWRKNRTTLLGEPFSFTQGEPDGVTKVTAWRFWQEYSHRSENQVLALRSTFTSAQNNLQNSAGLPPGGAPQPNTEYTLWLGQGHYARQMLGQGAQVILRGNLQRTSDTLLPLDRMSIGGIHTVRGYRENQVLADNGSIINLEFDYPLLRHQGKELNLALIPFYDWGHGRNFGNSAVTLSSAGLAARVGWQKFSLDLVLARRLVHPESVNRTGGTLQDHGVHCQITYNFF